MKITAPIIKSRKADGKITALTCYDYSLAKILDGEVDILLVGDSLGMVIYGFESTLPVTLEMMIAHGQAVNRGALQSMVVIDLPFGSYQQSPAQAFASAAKVLAATGAQAIKLEGGSEMAETVMFLTERGIPVMGHIGLQPQSFNNYGGYKIQGKDDADNFIKSAKDLEEAGCFAIVIEGVKQELAITITKKLKIPTIGIGAAAECDGQVLVLHDMLGLTEAPARFVKNYAGLNDVIKAAVRKYAGEVKNGRFPAKKNLY